MPTAKRGAPRRSAVARAVRIEGTAPPPMRGGSQQALALAVWAETLEDTAQRLREAAEQLERMGDFCRVCERVLREGLDALPLLLSRLGAQLLGDGPEALPGLLAGAVSGSGGPAEDDEDEGQPEGLARAG